MRGTAPRDADAAVDGPGASDVIRRVLAMLGLPEPVRQEDGSREAFELVLQAMDSDSKNDAPRGMPRRSSCPFVVSGDMPRASGGGAVGGAGASAEWW